ncbi:MAG: DUF1080 domain-containing protein [Planctomycetales bacterium]|nr:DUF1080 domain-containing protein [Planctomycetales bacterium]
MNDKSFATSTIWFLFASLTLSVCRAEAADNQPADQGEQCIDRDEPGWVDITGDDFANVNGAMDTWRWEGGVAYCSGKPTSVIRTKKKYTNFELVCEWRHRQEGGNSGIFVWATDESIERLTKAGKPGLPHGIEVQVLDLGYAELYEKRYKKPADWFTSHGDVFPVGAARMKPFPPVAPNGKRSFPSKQVSKGVDQWNHYCIRAVDGVIWLWVNGEKVSGGSDCQPRSGYLCLESEGAPVEFKNIRIRELP